jgi:hypothetical protein
MLSFVPLTQADAAELKIEEFLEKEEKATEEKERRRGMVAGCKTISNRFVVFSLAITKLHYYQCRTQVCRKSLKG